MGIIGMIVMMIVVLVVAVIILALSLFFATKGAADVAGSDDPLLKEAHKYLTWTATLGWIAIVVCIIAIVVFIFLTFEFIEFIAIPLVGVILLTVSAMTLAIGIMTALSAKRIGDSDAYANENDVDHDKATQSRNDCIVASVLSLGTLGLILLAGGYYYYKHWSESREEQKGKENLAKIQTELKLEAMLKAARGNTDVPAQ